MGTKVTAVIDFKHNFQGQLQLREGVLNIGIADHEARPYDLLQGALVACLHSTFLDILEKKHLAIDFAHYEVEGEKRDEIPTTLKSVNVVVTLPSGNEETMIKSMELAKKYCSVFNTISQVAQMHLEVRFK
jgi:putative redox protein